MSTGPHTRGTAEATLPATVFDNEAPEVTRTYAEALLEVAEKGGQVEAVLGELDEIRADVLEAHPRFAERLSSPSLTVEDRDRLLTELFEGRALPTVVRFLRVLNRHGRLGLLPAIARRARATWDRRQNRVPVTVRSAVPLDDGQRHALHERLGRLVGGTPVVRLEVDPGLIGGLVVQVGDDVYDASVRTRLRQLRRRVVEGRAHEVQTRRDQFTA